MLDQYGQGIRVDPNGNAYRITLTLAGNGTLYFTDTDPDTPGIQTTSDVVHTPGIGGGGTNRGMATALFAVDDIAPTTHSLRIAYQVAQARVDSGGVLIDGDTGAPGVQITYRDLTGATATGTAAPTYVYVAADNSHGNGEQVTVHQTFGGNAAEHVPATHFATQGSGSDHGVLYAMDGNDTYRNNGETAPRWLAFRPQVGDVVRIITYSTDPGEASIYDIIRSP